MLMMMLGPLVFGSNERQEGEKNWQRTPVWVGIVFYRVEGTVRYSVKAVLYVYSVYSIVCYGIALYGTVPVAKKGGIGQQIIKKGRYRATN